MATHVFDSLADGAAVTFAFNDVLQFQNAGSQAAFVSLHWFQANGTGGFDTQVRTQTGPFAGKSVLLLDTDILALTSANFSFGGGGSVFVGDNLSTSIQDNQANNIVGTAGSDYFAGLAGNDSLTGGAGDDRFHFFVTQGGAFTSYGQDTVSGGDGADWLVFDAFGEETLPVSVDLAAGTASGGYGLSGVTFSSIEGVIGTQFDDTLVGAAGNETLRGGAGDDILSGAGGGDFASYEDASAAVSADLSLGSAADGFGGIDSLLSIEGVLGGGGNDTLLGAAGNESLLGGAGADSVFGGAGDDFLHGNQGNDILRAGQGDDTAAGGQGADQLLGALGNDELRGGMGEDTMQGGQGSDTLFGGADNDFLQPRLGNDLVTGGAGNDMFWFNAAGPADADVITDFQSGDKIALAASFFSAGTTFGQHVIYDTVSGELSYDADAGGPGAALLIATLSGAPALAAQDIVLL
jgi:Ca2+-binding RTX toxin-like protein